MSAHDSQAGDAVDPGVSARGTEGPPRATDPDLFLLYRSSVEQLIDRVREVIQMNVRFNERAQAFYCAPCGRFDAHYDDCEIGQLKETMDHVIGIRQELEDQEKEREKTETRAERTS